MVEDEYRARPIEHYAEWRVAESVSGREHALMVHLADDIFDSLNRHSLYRDSATFGNFADQRNPGILPHSLGEQDSVDMALAL